MDADTRARRANIAGIGVSETDPERTVEQIEDWIRNGERQYISCLTAHGVVEAQRNPELRSAYNNSGLTVPDGMPIFWLSKAQGLDTQRVRGPDIVLNLCARSVEQGYRHFFYGSSDDTCRLMVTRLEQRFPGLPIAGHYSPPFRPVTPEEDDAIVEQINVARPDIVWVGLGTPKQDLWMASHVGRITAAALVGVGAAFDFHAGVKQEAPVWLQRTGFEWLFRLCCEPRRLGKRYLLYNPTFVWLIGLQMLRLRRYSLEPGPTRAEPGPRRELTRKRATGHARAHSRGQR